MAEPPIDAKPTRDEPTAHGAYHQGDVGVVLGPAVHSLHKRTAIGRWEWGVR